LQESQCYFSAGRFVFLDGRGNRQIIEINGNTTLISRRWAGQCSAEECQEDNRI
jgi:hypothetical protein